LIRYHAAWILPISQPPIQDGWVVVDRDRIAAFGRRNALSDAAADARIHREVDLGEVAVLPGLVNAHTHLELSYLRDEVPPASAFVSWIRGVMAARQRRPDPRAPEILGAVESAIAEVRAAGTAIVGDISNTLVTFEPLARSPLAAVVFYELIRFNVADAAGLVDAAAAELAALRPTRRVRASLAAHAPYSVAPLLFRAIRRAAERDAFTPCSVHLSESAEEVEFIRDGRGPWRTLLEEVGAFDPGWVPPGVSPVQFLDEAGFLGSNVIAVHGVQMTLDDLGRLRARGTTLVTCPRSNGHTGAGAPPIQDFYDAGVRVAIGTDSLASAPDLNLFAELATLRALAPDVPASALLASATLHGARALGFDGEYGTIEPEKRASLIAVNVPAGVDDVEEYLVGGIPPSHVRWIEES
jgi:cytosine/adenosine deaminase-related metal-dependent hydrolase